VPTLIVMTETNEDQRPDYLKGALYGVEGRLASLATAVTQVKIDIDAKRRTSPTGQGLEPVPAAEAEGFREGLQWALRLLQDLLCYALRVGPRFASASASCLGHCYVRRRSPYRCRNAVADRATDRLGEDKPTPFVSASTAFSRG